MQDVVFGLLAASSLLGLLWFTGRIKALVDGGRLFADTLYWVVFGPFTGKTRYRSLVFPLMHQIGVRSLFITCLVSLLVGGILVLQTADKFVEFGVIDFVPGMICVAVVRELGPLMTAIVISGRVGAAFTAGLGSMVINEEVLALKTMGINPVGYLVAPRFISIVIMLPCLTAFSYLIGNIGGMMIGNVLFNIPPAQYIAAAKAALTSTDMTAGLAKAAVFGALICMVACQNALHVRGGPEGVGRSTMVSVVMSLVMIIVSDGLINFYLASYLY